MEMEKYSELKQAGKVRLIRDGGRSVLLVTAYNPATGEPIEQREYHNIENVATKIAYLRNLLSGTEELYADMQKQIAEEVAPEPEVIS